MNKSCKLNSIKQHAFLITQTIQLWQKNHAERCRSNDALISNILLWTTIHRHARFSKNYHHQLCVNSGCLPEDLSRVALSAVAAKYTHSISVEVEDPLNECPTYDTKHSDGEGRVPNYCHRSQVHSGPEWQCLTVSFLGVKLNKLKT